MKLLVICFLFGLAYATPAANNKLGDLIDDFKDFLKLIPVEEIKAIADDHLENDGEFNQVVKYLQGSQWAELVEAVKSKEEWQNFEQYMVDAGLDIDGFFAKLHEFIANLVPGTDTGKGESIRSFLDEVEKIIPVDQLLSLLNDKLENSPDFIAFWGKISSQDAKGLVEEIRKLPEVQRVAQKLIDMGVRVKETLTIIYELLGWGSPF